MRRSLAVVPAALALVVSGLALPAAAAVPAGNEIAYVKQGYTTGVSSIVLRDLTTGRESTAVTGDDTAFLSDVALSPDRQKVAFVVDALVDSSEVVSLVVADRNGANQVTLATANYDTTGISLSDPAFSPDGSTVVYDRITPNNPDPGKATAFAFALFTAPAAGGSPTAVPGGGNGWRATYDPTDASRLVYVEVTDASNGSGTVSTLKGGTSTSLGAPGMSPTFSPDGSRIAFTDTGSTGVDLIPAAGGAVTELGRAGCSSASRPHWLPDGQSIVYALGGQYCSAIFAVNPTDKRHGQVVDLTSRFALYSVGVGGPAPTTVSPAGGLSSFVPVQPTRLLDSRTSNGGHQGVFSSGEAFALQVTGRTLEGGGTVPAITSAVLNVTVTGNTAPGYVQVYPAPASPAPSTSSLNATAAQQTRANQVTVAVPASGQVVVRNTAGSAHVIVDITGYYVSGTTGAAFGATTPTRLLDTRNGTGAAKGAVGQGGYVDLKVTGGAVPADATAVTLNLTGTGATRATNVRAYPTPSGTAAAPNVSSLNLVPGETAPNLVTVKVGQGGRVRLQNAVGSVQLIADVAGFYGGTGATAYYQAVSPTRFLDTRVGVGAAPITTTAQAGVDLLVESFRGLPGGIDSVVLNVTGTGVTAATNVRAYPSGTTKPTVSNLNLAPGDTRANAVLAAPGTNGRVRIVNEAGSTHLIADVAGYFTTPAA